MAPSACCVVGALTTSAAGRPPEGPSRRRHRRRRRREGTRGPMPGTSDASSLRPPASLLLIRPPVRVRSIVAAAPGRAAAGERQLLLAAPSARARLKQLVTVRCGAATAADRRCRAGRRPSGSGPARSGQSPGPGCRRDLDAEQRGDGPGFSGRRLPWRGWLRWRPSSNRFAHREKRPIGDRPGPGWRPRSS